MDTSFFHVHYFGKIINNMLKSIKAIYGQSFPKTFIIFVLHALKLYHAD
jgi:hypothetical protein